MSATKPFQSFHQEYIDSNHMLSYEYAYGPHGFDAYRRSPNYDQWVANTFPVGGNRSLTIEELESVIRDRVYPIAKKAADSAVFERMQIAALRQNGNDAATKAHETDLEAKLNACVRETALDACNFLNGMAHQNRMTVPVVEGILTEEYWYPFMRATMNDLDSFYRPSELAKVRDEYHGDTELIADVYDDDKVLRQLLNESIPDFEYPDFGHRTVDSVIKEIERKLESKASISTLRNMGALPSDAVVVDTPPAENSLDEPVSAPKAAATPNL
jgi:hypothetical protein